MSVLESGNSFVQNTEIDLYAIISTICWLQYHLQQVRLQLSQILPDVKPSSRVSFEFLKYQRGYITYLVRWKKHKIGTLIMPICGLKEWMQYQFKVQWQVRAILEINSDQVLSVVPWSNQPFCFNNHKIVEIVKEK